MEKYEMYDSIGRFISLILRHKPHVAGITLDAHGWADVDSLIAGVCGTGRFLDAEMLEKIVQEDTKQRYSFNEDHTKIRANQGHSIAVDVQLREVQPPALLYHGTAKRFLDSILERGIDKRQRQYVHLSTDIATAEKVGARHGAPVVLIVDAGAMVQSGIKFYKSENGVWLCDYVPPVYIRVFG